MRNLKVLVAEDEPFDVELYKEILNEASDVKYDILQDGVSLLAKFKKEFKKGERILVISNYAMPGMNGLDAIKEMRQFERDNGYNKPNAAMYLTSADNDSSVKKAALDAGATGFLEKPLFVDQFRKIIDKYRSSQ